MFVCWRGCVFVCLRVGVIVCWHLGVVAFLCSYVYCCACGCACAVVLVCVFLGLGTLSGITGNQKGQAWVSCTTSLLPCDEDCFSGAAGFGHLPE